MRFLTSVCKAKHVQFVLSTHSPTLIRDLPAGAIKVLQVDVQSGKVLLASQSSPAIVAFASIGHAHSDVPTIYVEDALAKELVLAAIRGDNGKYLGKVKVDFLEGGCDALWGTYIPIWAREDRTNTYVFFDGDQTRRSPKEDTQIPSGQLDFEIEETFGSPPTILVDGSGGQGREDQKEHRKRRLLAWRARHVQFLPGDTPEALVLAMVGGGPSVAPKQQWDERTKADLGLIDGEATDSREILSTQRRALATVDKDNAEFDNIRQLVLGAVEGAPSHLAPGGKNASR